MGNNSVKFHHFFELHPEPHSKFEKIFGKDLFKEIRDYLLVNRLCIENQKKIQFDYVGIILIKDKVISILPKYLKNINFNFKAYTKLIIQVLKKYNKSSNDISDFYFDSDEKQLLHHKFSLIDYLLKDYYEYGIYENTIDILDENGFGEISWDETIEREIAYLSKKRPTYLEFWTHEVDSDTGNYITLLHQSILNKSVDYLKSNEVNQLLNRMDIPDLFFPVEDDSVGDLEYQIKMIDEELKIQFNERKINLLKILKSFLLEESLKSEIHFSLWGTGTFYTVWEKVCGEVFKNEYKKGNRFKESINKNTKAHWKTIKKYSEPMVPDIIFTENKITYLIDAKYYTEAGLEKMAIQDIAKQFLYLEAIKGEIKGEYKNIFISPGTENKFYSDIVISLFPNEKVISIFLNAEEIFNNYVENKNLNFTKIFNETLNYQ